MAQYHFIGGDGKTYGPYSQEQMQQFMAENRVNAQTQMSADGAAWQPAGQFPELAGTTGASRVPATLGIPAAPGLPQPIAVNPSAVQAAVNGPAVFMMVLAGLNIAFALFGLVMNLFFGGMGLAGAPSGGTQEQMIIQAISGVVGNICGIIISILILVGANKMRKLQSYGLAMTACILSIICCPCCIGIGPGIWGIVVLCKPEVKAAFH